MKLRGLPLLLWTVLALSGLGISPASAQGDPHYAEPTVGECHDYPAKVTGHHSEPSPGEVCDGTQTAHTFAVIDVPHGIPLKNGKKLYDYFAHRCDRAFTKALGTKKETILALTAYTWVWYAPTKAQQKQGAHWVRCDAVLYGGKNKIAPVPVSLKLGRPPVDDAVARCLVSGSYRTVCTRTHQFRSKKAFQMSGSRYPTKDQFNHAVAQRCPRLYYVPPSADSWKAGYKVVVCYAKTSR